MFVPCIFSCSDNQKKTKTFTSTPIAGSPGKFNLAGEGTEIYIQYMDHLLLEIKLSIYIIINTLGCFSDQEPGFTKTLTFLDTDYTNYAVTVTCITNGQVHGRKFFDLFYSVMCLMIK